MEQFPPTVILWKKNIHGKTFQEIPCWSSQRNPQNPEIIPGDISEALSREIIKRIPVSIVDKISSIIPVKSPEGIFETNPGKLLKES